MTKKQARLDGQAIARRYLQLKAVNLCVDMDAWSQAIREVNHKRIRMVSYRCGSYLNPRIVLARDNGVMSILKGRS